MRALLAATIALCLTFFASTALAQKPGVAGLSSAGGERIHTYDSDIVIEENGDLMVTETITVTALGRDIRRGIYRDFPTRYRDRYGNRVTVGFDVLEVLRDGRAEPWHTENVSNGVRIYVGDADTFLQNGQYTYTIRYRTTNQLHFGDSLDEIYFNITGNGWAFPIDSASATIHLPQNALALTAEGYTGRFGSSEQAYRIDRDTPGLVTLRATRALGPQDGFTISVSFEKGNVAPPSAIDRTGRLLADNAPLLIGLFGVLVIFAYYHLSWLRVGRDPTKGTVVPLFEPPQDFSPAATRFVDRMGFDQKAFTAAIINMAVKGFLTIEEEGRSFKLVKAAGDPSVLSPGEKKLGEKLLGTRSSIKLKQSHHETFSSAISALKSSLKREYEAANFIRNTQYMIPGVGGTIIILVLMGFASYDPGASLVSMGWLGGWTVFAGIISYAGYERIRDGGLGRTVGGILLLLLSFVMVGVGTIFFFALPAPLGVPTLLLIVLMGLLSPLYFELLKAPTAKGRKIMDQIEGFRMYLSIAERHRLEGLHPPEKTPELFEKYLPYALALGVENEWSEQFDDVLSKAMVDGEPYHPHWYHGARWNRFGAAGFAGAISSSVTTSIAAAATAPGSSSGVGGGGFSGGGGGGGGGGGW